MELVQEHHTYFHRIERKAVVPLFSLARSLSVATLSFCWALGPTVNGLSSPAAQNISRSEGRGEAYR